MTVDIALGNFLDKITWDVYKRMDLLEDTAQINEFVKEYNSTNRIKIPHDYFKDITKWSPTGKTLEKLARYGDSREFELPIPAKLDSLANMSYSGLYSQINFLLFTRKKGGKDQTEVYQRQPSEMTFKQLLNLCASTQFAAFYQVQRKVSSVL